MQILSTFAISGVVLQCAWMDMWNGFSVGEPYGSRLSETVLFMSCNSPQSSVLFQHSTETCAGQAGPGLCDLDLSYTDSDIEKMQNKLEAACWSPQCLQSLLYTMGTRRNRQSSIIIQRLQYILCNHLSYNKGQVLLISWIIFHPVWFYLHQTYFFYFNITFTTKKSKQQHAITFNLFWVWFTKGVEAVHLAKSMIVFTLNTNHVQGKCTKNCIFFLAHDWLVKVNTFISVFTLQNEQP